MAVAAAAVVLFSLGSYWFVQDARQETTQVVSQVVPDTKIIPGANKAVLTLSNGSKVELDSAAHSLQHQAGTGGDQQKEK